MCPAKKARMTWQTTGTRLDNDRGIVLIDLDRSSNRTVGPLVSSRPPRDGVVVTREMVPAVVKRAAAEAKGELQVELDPITGRAISVGLRYADGLMPTDLQRFPWATFLALADAADRGLRADPLSDEAEHLSETTWAQLKGTRLRKPKKDAKRPGRRGHPPEHYLSVANRYQELRSQGMTNPTATIAMESHVSRHTVAGWVRGARDRDYLPPARPGRAG
jgi:hypothetical protein